MTSSSVLDTAATGYARDRELTAYRENRLPSRDQVDVVPGGGCHPSRPP
jgi:hypothetical protein